MTLLATGFFITALLYASVGFGGGSTYTALLVFAGADYRVLPVVALACNIIVVTGGSIRFARAGLVPWRRLAPLVALSVPFAFLGGRMPIREAMFLILLGTSLLAAGMLLVLQKPPVRAATPAAPRPLIDGALGGAVGFLSGLVGIGGGIFLSPIQHLMRWAAPRQIAATASIFILVNSLAGLAGQLTKPGAMGIAGLGAWWPLFAAVLIGGQIGSHAGITLFSEPLVRRATGILIVAIAIQLLWKTLSG
jgi:uncharacterized protein